MLSAHVAAHTIVYSVGGTTSGSYLDYIKTGYACARNPEVIQLPLTSFDKNFGLNPMAAKK